MQGDLGRARTQVSQESGAPQFLNVENFLLYQMQHNYILNQQKVKPKWISLNLVLNNTEVNVVAINADSLAATDEPSKY